MKLHFHLVFLFLLSCKEPETSHTPNPNPREEASPDEIAASVVRNEEMVLKMTSHFKNLARDLQAGQIPLGRIPVEWHPFMKTDHTWLSAGFGTLAGTFEGPQFVTKSKFEGLVQKADGSLVGIKAKQNLTWSSPDATLSLVSWSQLEFHALPSPRTLFEDTTKKAIPPRFARDEAQRSKHYEITEQALSQQQLILPKRE